MYNTEIVIKHLPFCDIYMFICFIFPKNEKVP